jgi:A/G-specific adenine glycosylase
MIDQAGRQAAFRRALLRWYAREHRTLPWRAKPGCNGDPYHVLVSEAMLQQTQVATVIDYFRRFIAAFPSLDDLAAADEQQVLRLWQGLGYYRRARHLHRAAQVIVAEHDGRVPDDVSGLLALPGVGRYTAGAIASIAYGKRKPVVDGNVTRVLARVAGIDKPVDDTQVTKQMWRLAEELLPVRAGHPGDFNQAMMELGATVCLPKSPRCGRCPVKRDCQAHAQGRVDELPVTRPRKQPTKVTHHVYALERRGKFVLRQRGSESLWAGMWELPTCETADGDSTLGLTTDKPNHLGRFVHITTHRRITFEVWHAMVTGGRLKRSAGIWRKLEDVDDLPLAAPQQRVISLLQESRQRHSR